MNEYTQPALFPVEDIQTDGYAQPESDDQADAEDQPEAGRRLHFDPPRWAA
ncbi:hypothetical protein [Streptomyces sp. NBC_01353]|uniref:hypothetical protein n=1 Tax=Streptomyces sp. NBC_01353 TaxID=2903835 RepID=UPI002E304944|nr:hypothetical protein [Streptomyces sp. NBC_01353]